MSSRSIVSASSWLGALIVLLVWTAPAAAGRRVVVLDFDGPKAERFRDDVEAAIAKALGKGHTVVELDDWLEEAEELGATKVTARNVKKVARKLKIDGVVVGEIEKRGQRYYLHLRLREGVSGEYVAEVDIVVRQAKLGADGARIVKDELIPAIKELTAVKGGRDDDDEAPARGKKRAKADSKSAKSKSAKGKKGQRGKRVDVEDDLEDDGGRRASGFGKKRANSAKGDDAVAKTKGAKRKAASDDDDDEDVEPAPRRGNKGGKKAATKSKKAPEPEPDDDEADDDEAKDDDRVALGGDRVDDEGIERTVASDADVDADPRFVAARLSAGMSATARRLGFRTAPGATPAQGYRGKPVAGVVIAADLYPLAFDKTNRSVTRNLGVSVSFDRVVKITSRLDTDDDGTPDLGLATTQQRYSLGLLYRHPVGSQALVEASVGYNRMQFVIDRGDAPPGSVQIPNVDYAFLDPGVAVRYFLSERLEVGAGASLGLVLDTGDMQRMDEYGAATVLGLDLEAGATYMMTGQLGIRGDLRATTFGFTFDGSGAMSNPDGDGTVDIPGGRDSYFGVTVTAGYLF
jgi:hypothetical protein